MAAIANIKRRRGVARASLTRLSNRVKELEPESRDPKTPDLAERMAVKLSELDSDFRDQHHALIDLIEGDEALERQQETLDAHDDLVTELSVRIKQIISASSPSAINSSRKALSRKLIHIQKSIDSIASFVTDTSTAADTDVCLLRQYIEKAADINRDLSKVRDDLHHLDIDDTDELFGQQERLEGQVFDCSVNMKKLLFSVPASSVTSTPSSDGKGVKLPKLDVPKFDGEILNWRSFWEQFCISVHDRTNLSDAEKLVYLQQSLKGGSAKSTIEGLSRSGDNYAEAVGCLQSRYDRPRLIHKAHVRMILDTPSLKEGSGKELRRLHDTVQQHLRALKAMEHEAPGPFITSTLELKLDQNTLFEWHKHSGESTTVPHYNDLLDFINLRAQASESFTLSSKGSSTFSGKKQSFIKPVASFTASASDSQSNCLICKPEKHPLYACPRFKLMSHEQKIEVLKSNNLCMNCLRPGHFVKNCKSLHHCKVCQKSHHTLLHIDSSAAISPPSPKPPNSPTVTPLVTSNAAACLAQNSLLMTCRVLVEAPDGSLVNARALLDSASSASFISERLVNSLCLPRLRRNTIISGVAGLTHNSIQSLTSITISSPQTTHKYSLTAIVVPRVTCDLPVHPVTPPSTWNHLDNLSLADPDFARPGRVDLLLGVDVFTESLLHGRRIGPPGSPVAFETAFGWVLAGPTSNPSSDSVVTSHHTLVTTSDDLLRRFWEVEEDTKHETILSPEEKFVVQHFEENHRRTAEGRFIVPLPKKHNHPPIGESRSQAVRRFLSLERSLRSKGEFDALDSVIQEYFNLKHAEPVPDADCDKPSQQVFYLPMHAVKKESSTTTRVRVVFDASAKSSSGTSLNDILHVGPTVHSPLIDVLLRFRLHRIALTADVSKMYRAIELVGSDRDLHRFVWRSSPNDPLTDYRMTRVTFGVSASSFAANMSVKRNALDNTLGFPKAADVVATSFYVDDCLTGAESVEKAVDLHQQLVTLFHKGGFLLRKWNSSNPQVVDRIDPDLRDVQPTHQIPTPEDYTKTFGIEWNASMDYFRLAVTPLKEAEHMTKRALVSDIAKTFDVLGWFAPTIIKAKILLQRVWEAKIGWDDVLPKSIHHEWTIWRSELPLLTGRHVPRCYYPKHIRVTSVELHGFSDASEEAYAGVVYIRVQDSSGNVHSSLVLAKTKVAPIKRLTIPRLELCGAKLLSQLLQHAQRALNISIHNTFAWTDSTIVLNWLVGSPRRFKTFVGNRISHIMQSIPPERWNHVRSTDNPADCASRGLFPSELLGHKLWWDGPEWLRLCPDQWPSKSPAPKVEMPVDEEKSICLHIVVNSEPAIPLDRCSSFSHLKRLTAWMFRFIHNCRKLNNDRSNSLYLSTAELAASEVYWMSLTQSQAYHSEIESLTNGEFLTKSSRLFSLHPFVDPSGLLRVGGRGQNSQMSFSVIHPVILPGKHPITSLLIVSEHRRLLHAGPTFLAASLGRRYHIISCRKIIHSITHNCVICRRYTARPNPQLQGQLPAERITPDVVFNRVGLDYAGPFLLKYGSPRKSTIIKAYVCVFVSLTVKAVHLELVSDLTTDAFVAALRRFAARRGKPSLIWSDHGTNFVGAARELRQFIDFFQSQKTQGLISEFCAMQGITWKFIPERTPHFGGLWEAAVKSMKAHLKRVVGETKLTFEEFTTILTQIEACLNSRPLAPLPCNGDTLESLTPGHFLIGRPLQALPDPPESYREIALLKRWHLCQSMVRHFWKRWSSEYINIIHRFNKWHFPTRNLKIDDIVVLHDDKLIPTRWPLGRIIKTYPGKDSLVRVVDVKTSHGVYKRPTVKIALLLANEN